MGRSPGFTNAPGFDLITMPRVAQFTRDGNHAAIGFNGPSGRLVSTRAGALVCEFTSPDATEIGTVAIHSSTDSTGAERIEIAANSGRNWIYFWDGQCNPLGRQEVDAPLDYPANREIASLKYSPDGRQIGIIKADGLYLIPRNTPSESPAKSLDSHREDE